MSDVSLTPTPLLDRFDDIVHALDDYVALAVRQGRPFDSLGNRVLDADVHRARAELVDRLRRNLADGQ